MQDTSTQLANFDKNVLDRASHVEALEYISMYAKNLVDVSMTFKPATKRGEHPATC